MKDIFFKTTMLKGEAGNSIVSIEKTSSALNVDTYTITLSDGSTFEFEVTNGSSIESIEKTGTSGYVDTYTITLTNGDTTTFEVQNGEDGAGYEVPAGAVLYFDSTDPVPEGYEASSNPDLSDISALQADVAALKANSSLETIVETSLANLEAALLSVFSGMSNQQVKVCYLFPNFSSTAFFAGAIQVAILIRKESGVYRVALPNICGDMYFYSNSWHYSKATMSAITP